MKAIGMAFIKFSLNISRRRFDVSVTWRSRARFSKIPKTLQAQKAIRKALTRLFCKADLFICWEQKLK